MLTPGPSDPHWPEHLALSRDLACALVEARDLTVRGGILSIKTLDGLQAVDVLVRRVGGGNLDPLELPSAGNGVTGPAGRRGGRAPSASSTTRAPPPSRPPPSPPSCPPSPAAS